MIYKVDNNEEFKKNNLTNWHKNTEFWLQGKMRHLLDVYDYTGQQLQSIIDSMATKKELTIIDFGCGEGWLYRLIKDRNFSSHYIGLDFNIKFINHLKHLHGADTKAEFHCIDFEESPPSNLINRGDIGINFFNFFEIPDIEMAFKNVVKMLNNNSHLLIVNIDPIMQILAVSSSEKEFYNNLKLYEKYKTRLGYDKDIDVGDLRSNRIYKSLLYSTATYVELAKKNNLSLYDYKEVIKTGNIVPQIYQYIYFKKND